jgi:hypothetical protein
MGRSRDSGLQRVFQARLQAGQEPAADANLGSIPQHGHVVAVSVLAQLVDHVDVDDGRARTRRAP